MQVFLDGRPLEVAGDSLTAAIDAALQGAGDRMVVEVLADGQPVPAEHLEEPPTTAPYAQEVRFRSADKMSMARVTLHEAADALERVQEIQAKAAEKVRKGAVDEGIQTLGEALDSWASVRSAVDMMSGVGLIEPERMVDANGSFAQSLQKLAETLAEVKRSIANMDWSALGDALAYDLQDHAQGLGGWLRQLAQQMGDDSEPANS